MTNEIAKRDDKKSLERWENEGGRLEQRREDGLSET